MRRRVDVEAQVLEVIERIRRGQSVEDDLTVEVKAEAQPTQRIARRIAGHANAARGVPILWIMGVDEKRADAPITGSSIDLANWWPQLEAHFDERFAPPYQAVSIPVDGRTVLALDMETDRGPFVVKIPDSDLLEVPYRGSTRIRSARRSDLLRMLTTAARRPRIEVQAAEVIRSIDQAGGPTVTMTVEVYWHLPMGQEIVLRDADASATLWHFSDARTEAAKVSLHVPRQRSMRLLRQRSGGGVGEDDGRRYTSRSGEEQLILDGPGPGSISAVWTDEPEGISTGRRVQGRVSCRVVGDDVDVTAEFSATRDINPDWQRSDEERSRESLKWTC